MIVLLLGAVLVFVVVILLAWVEARSDAADYRAHMDRVNGNG